MAVNFRFDKDFDFDVRANEGALANRTVAYKAGGTHLIPDAHAEAAEKAGVGERVSDKAAAREKAKG